MYRARALVLADQGGAPGAAPIPTKVKSWNRHCHMLFDQLRPVIEGMKSVYNL